MAHVETERKFLVKGEFRQQACSVTHIVQGYLCSCPERTVRIRIRDDKGYITIKGAGDGISRYEWEKEISVDDALELIKLCEPGVIDKERYLVPNSDGVHTWEVDVFHADNEGLVMAEVELGSEDEHFDRPEWLGQEVTGDKRYYNSMLKSNPYKNW